MELTAEPLLILNDSTQAIANSKSAPEPCVKQPTAKQLAARISVETAAKMHAAKAAKRKALEDALRQAKEEVALATTQTPQNDAEYRRQQLTHTRDEIKACQNAMQSLRNGPARDYKAMSDALWRLREIERHLAGWPGPGNNQPSKRQPHPISATIEPL